MTQKDRDSIASNIASNWTKNEQTIIDAQNELLADALQPKQNLGLAILIAENDLGHYEPVGVVGTIQEAREMAQHDMAHRLAELAQDRSPMAADIYRLWGMKSNGYELLTSIDAF